MLIVFNWACLTLCNSILLRIVRVLNLNDMWHMNKLMSSARWEKLKNRRASIVMPFALVNQLTPDMFY